MYRILILSLVSLVAGCSWLDFSSSESKPTPLKSFDAEVKVRKLWSRDVGAGIDDRRIRLQPVVAGEYIYGADSEGQVVAINRSTGKQVWEIELDLPVSGGVGAGFGLVVVGTLKGEVIALEAATGEERWRAKVSSEVVAAPATNGDVVAVKSFDGKLFTFDAKSGAKLWHHESSVPVLSLRGASAPQATDTMIIAGFASGKLIAFSTREGLVRWEQRIATPKGRSEFERVIDIDGTPLLVGDIVVAASYQGHVKAVSRGNGRGLWVQDASSFTNLGHDFVRIYMTSANDTVEALSLANGETQWVNEQFLNRSCTGPQSVAEYVAVADKEGYVHLLARDDGRVVGRKKVGGGVSTPMTSQEDVLYLQDDDGTITALQVIKK